jgi:hypothetical protein
MSNETAGKDVRAEEKRLYLPPRDLVENSNVMQWMRKKGFKTEAEMRTWTGENYVEFWDEMARAYADWFEPYEAALDWKPPIAKWFVGGNATLLTTPSKGMRIPGDGTRSHTSSWASQSETYSRSPTSS